MEAIYSSLFHPTSPPRGSKSQFSSDKPKILLWIFVQNTQSLVISSRIVAAAIMNSLTTNTGSRHSEAEWMKHKDRIWRRYIIDETPIKDLLVELQRLGICVTCALSAPSSALPK